MATTSPDTPATGDGAREHTHNWLVRYFKVLGPGLVTGASDDDPSGITTYSIAGASFGYSLLWTAGVTFPLMAAIQLICARIGLVSGSGLAAAIRSQYPRAFLYGACGLLLVANVFNIAADLSGMADAIQMLTGTSPGLVIPVIGVFMIVTTIYLDYGVFAQYLKWLTAVLLAYVISAFLSKPEWGAALRASLVPSVHWDKDSVTMLVGILGTTISPYLFFWQAAQTVEEEKARGRNTVAQRRGATAHELRDAKIDVTVGMLWSNVVMYFIILTTASTLYRAGDKIQTSRQAAEALRPLAGDWAYLLFTVGIIGTGLLAIPVLAGSASYAVAELFGWRTGLGLRPWQGRRFYLVLAAAIVGGIAFNVLDIDAMKLLLYSAVLNGLLAAPLMVLVMLVGNNRKIMGPHTNGLWLNVLGWTATAAMALASVAFFVSALA
jgi:NRAMP (natural resistance-associated macrophage protein)-like metal ion transporter